MIKKLSLHHYRNFKSYQLNLSKNHVVLYGENGAGKTNILEAISLFSIGKGLKKASAQDIERQLSPQNQPTFPTGWSAHLNLDDDLLLKTSFSPQLTGNFKRISSIQDTPIKNHTEFTQYINVLWITPETDRLFLDTPSTRRKFVDRFVYAQDVLHLKHVISFEHAVKERLHVLKNFGKSETAWLDALEKTIVEEGFCIANSRRNMLKKLSSFTPHGAEVGILPGFIATMRGPFEDLFLQYDTTKQIKDAFLKILYDNRPLDEKIGMTKFGPHRSDLSVFHPIKEIDVFQCSTGEQKILLLSLLIAFIEQFCLNAETLTVFLLDDVIAHLDAPHRFVLFNRLMKHHNTPFQAWFSGTDASFFTPLKDHADFIEVNSQ